MALEHHEFGLALLRAFGLEQTNVRNVTLAVDVDDAPVLVVTYRIPVQGIAARVAEALDPAPPQEGVVVKSQRLDTTSLGDEYETSELSAERSV